MPILFHFKNTVLLLVLLLASCGKQPKKSENKDQIALIENKIEKPKPIGVGANSTAKYLPLLQNKKIAVVANQTSVIFKKHQASSIKYQVSSLKYKASNPEKIYTHLVDSLLSLDVDLVKVFAPEHGFRGKADAGESVLDAVDTKTGLPLISLHGKNRKPSAESLKGIEIVVFDIQDVGVRFYTYIATLQLVMEACAENNIPIIVLDRPNPNGHYIDGPTMEAQYTSFLGMTTIPLVYGMTIGEYAKMLNGENWLENKVKSDLTVIQLENYTHNSEYHLTIRPSPNLPNDTSINLYPSLGLFEGTNLNAGRGTEFQFQRYGASFLDSTQYTFKYTPQPNFGSKYPKEEAKICFGNDLSETSKMNEISLRWMIDAYQNTIDKSKFFITNGFTKHAGTETLQQQIEAGLSEKDIKASWQPDLENFKKIRRKYLIYE